jgi:hypothetical protein
VITAKLYTNHRVQPALTTMSRKHANVTVDGVQYRLDIEPVKRGVHVTDFQVVSFESKHGYKALLKSSHTEQEIAPLPEHETSPYTGVIALG